MFETHFGLVHGNLNTCKELFALFCNLITFVAKLPRVEFHFLLLFISTLCIKISKSQSKSQISLSQS